MVPKNNILILSAYSENIPWNNYGKNDYVEVSMEVNSRYAERNGYSFKCIKYKDEDMDGDFGPTWIKIDSILKFLNLYDYVFWIDADAIIVNDIEIESLFGKDIALTKCVIDSNEPVSYTTTSTGFMLIKNSDFSFSVFKNLKEQSEKWFNGDFRKGYWHEQGLLDKMYIDPQIVQTYRFDDNYYNLVNKEINDIDGCFETKNFRIYPFAYQSENAEKIQFIFHAGGDTPTKKERLKDIANRHVKNAREVSKKEGSTVDRFFGEDSGNRVNFTNKFEQENSSLKIFITLEEDSLGLNTIIYYKELDTDLTIYHVKSDFLYKGFCVWSDIPIDCNTIGGIKIEILNTLDNSIIYSEEIRYNPSKNEKFYTDINDMAWGYFKEIFNDESYRYQSVSNKENIVQIEEGDVCLDIGANYGIFSRYAIGKGAKKVYAVEAFAPVCEYLNKNLSGKNVKVINKALGDKNENRYFISSRDSSANNHLEGLVRNYINTNLERTTISVMNINDFLKAYEIRNIDYLKIDCEGAEYEIFETIDEDYLSHNIRKIVGEYHDSHNGEVDVLLDKLKKCGFECEHTIPDKQWGHGYLAWKNAKVIEEFSSDNKVKDRCYLLFCDEAYYNIMVNVLILLDKFSEYKVLVYTVNFSPKDSFKNVIWRRIDDNNLLEYQTDGKNHLIKNDWDKTMYLCFSKINVIMKSLEEDFDEFVYLDVDTFPTSNINNIFEIATKGLNYPILPKYNYEIMIYGDKGDPWVDGSYDETKTLEWWLIEKLGLAESCERSHYRNSFFFYYNKKCKTFWEECLKIVSNEEIFRNQNEFFGDESVINVLLWKIKGVEYFENKNSISFSTGGNLTTFKEVDNFFKKFQNDYKLDETWLLHGKVYSIIFKEQILSDYKHDETESKKINNYFVNKIINGLIDNKDKEIEGKKVYVSFDSKSLGDNLAWTPYAEEFRKKHNCEVVLATFWNHLFEKEYPEIEFVEPGTAVDGVYKKYNIGWYFPWDASRNPNDFRTIPLQQAASDILGLEYKEIKPIILMP